MSEIKLASFFEAAIEFMDHPENDFVNHVQVASSATADLRLYGLSSPMQPSGGLIHATADKLFANLSNFFGARTEYRPKLADRPFAEFAVVAPGIRFVSEDRTQFWPIQRDAGKAELWLSVRQAPWQGYGSFARVDIQRPKSGAHVAILR
ncbi:hypothetical protein HYW44_03600 [Candidatus Daviesbacteria bacterium]|nr:hypothetical protein [Candidatus Daviesbacteria bacterium]